MNLSRALGALAGGMGLVLGVVGAAVAAAVVVVALGVPDEVRADDSPTPVPSAPAAPPSELVVGLGLSDPALVAGVVRGRELVLARGLEVEVARKLAERLRIRKVRFVAVRPSSRLLANHAQWDIALTAIASPRIPSSVDVTMPYLATDQALVTRRGLERPGTRARLRTLQLCAVKRTSGAQAVAAVGATRTALRAPNRRRLVQLLQTGVCDVAAVDAVEAGRFVADNRAVLGSVSGRLLFGSGMVVVVSRDSAVPVTAVDRVVHRLRANGTLSKLARFWLGVDPAALPIVR
ncbi:MAG: transporter substrate-binding domain-containing protein [Gaiellales bacterium]